MNLFVTDEARFSCKIIIGCELSHVGGCFFDAAAEALGKYHRQYFHLEPCLCWMKILQMNSLKNKWVLITGASSGFGAAAASAFGAAGAKLLLGARRVDRLKQVAAESKKAGAGEALFHELDV